MMKTLKRTLALLLVFCMMLEYFPGTVFAEDEQTTDAAYNEAASVEEEKEEAPNDAEYINVASIDYSEYCRICRHGAIFHKGESGLIQEDDDLIEFCDLCVAASQSPCAGMIWEDCKGDDEEIPIPPHDELPDTLNGYPVTWPEGTQNFLGDINCQHGDVIISASDPDTFYCNDSLWRIDELAEDTYTVCDDGCKVILGSGIHPLAEVKAALEAMTDADCVGLIKDDDAYYDVANIRQIVRRLVNVTAVKKTSDGWVIDAANDTYKLYLYGAHSFSNASCTNCGVKCTHSDSASGICASCGLKVDNCSDCDGTGCENCDGAGKVIAVTGLTLDKENISLHVGETLKLTATVLPDVAHDKGVLWVSEDDDVATVDAQHGFVTAVAPGTATICVFADGGDFEASCVVTVTPAIDTSYLIIKDNTVTGYVADKMPADGKIYIPVNVTTIGRDAFEDCEELTSVEMPGVTTIEEFGFEGCKNLTSVEMPSVTTIGLFAFYKCIKLTHITLPASVQTVDSLAFDYCESVRSVVITSSSARIDDIAFSGVSADTLTLPADWPENDRPDADGNWKDGTFKTVKYVDFNGSLGGDNNCIYEENAKLKDGTFKLYLNKQLVGEYTFEHVRGGYAIRDAEGYLTVKNGKLVHSENPAPWSAKHGGLAMSTRRTTYYLASASSVSTKAVKMELRKEIVSTEHRYGKWSSNQDGTHSRKCKHCEGIQTEDCVYNEKTHKCGVCGFFDPAAKSVKVSVKEKVSRIGHFFKRTTYTYTIKTSAEGVKVSKVQYYDGSRWVKGTSFKTHTRQDALKIRITDSTGTVWNFTYQNGQVISE